MTGLNGLGNIDARPYQQRIVSKALAMFQGEHHTRTGERDITANSVMIESPTGSGKTVMGLMVAKWMQHHLGMRVGWVAMRRNLLAQAADENLKKGFQVDLQTISMFEKNPPKVDLLIVDEAQHDAAQSMGDLHAIIKPQKILGLTATPYRTDRMKLCFERVIKDAGIHQLIQDGYLSQYHHYTMPAYTPELVAEFYLREPEHWGKTLVFFHRHDQCIQCRQILEQAGVGCDVVTAKSNREVQLERFIAGEIPVLINMAILTEGFDCPSLKTVFCRPSGAGCTVQMGGRVFRKHPELPYKQIVQCKETRHPFIKTAHAAEQYLWMDNTWRTLKINQRLASISHNAFHVIAAARAELPALVKMHRPTSARWGLNGPAMIHHEE